MFGFVVAHWESDVVICVREKTFRDDFVAHVARGPEEMEETNTMRRWKRDEVLIYEVGDAGDVVFE